MSAADILKAALEKKKSQNIGQDKKNAGTNEKNISTGQIRSNKPAKKSAGRGR